MADWASSPIRREPWWTVNPDTGEPVRVLPAELVEAAQRKAHESDAKINALCEAASRLRILHRRTRVLHDSTPDEIEEARREMREAIDWMARGGIEGQPEALRHG